jgi:type IV pilus assembly protein PilB
LKQHDAERAELMAEETGRSFGELVVEWGLAEEGDVYRQLAAGGGLVFTEVERVLDVIDAGLTRRLSQRLQERKKAIPVLLEQDTVVVATCDPEARVLDIASVFEAGEARLWLLTPTDFRRLQWALDLGQVVGAEVPLEVATESPDLLTHDVRLEPECVQLLDAILTEAIGERASDIHLESYGTRVRVRLRVDGELHELPRFQISPEQLLGLINVIKIRARLDIAERRLPQGGRYATRLGSHEFDLRVQTQPTLHGEFVVIRLLAQDENLFSVDKLGYTEELASTYTRLLRSPSGLVLLVGPTGCGKSTTLYAGLQLLARDVTRKVITVEDPIEYGIDQVQQTQVQPGLGFGFAQALRTFVREDPDVILVGEIRDQETALEAMRASQTGHLVLSTLHANDAVDAVQRLFDLGMHPNTIAAELLAVFAQRLAKRICGACRSEVEPEPKILTEVFPEGAPADFRTFRGEGCSRCAGRGTRGRIAVSEYLPTSRELRSAIAHHLALDGLRGVAEASGLRAMREQALELVREGVIAFEELPRLFSQEMLAG